MMKFTKEESVYVEQLADIRKKINILQVEEATQTDRILSILRGHQAQVAMSADNKFIVTRGVKDSVESVLVEGTPW